MLKTIWMTDPHLTAEGIQHGHNSRTRLKAAVTNINEQHSDAEFCIISGDLVNNETAVDYAALRDILSGLKIKYFPMMGNHDERDLLRAALPLPANCMDEFIQYSISTSEGVMICLDTHSLGEVHGEFCQKRLDWLKQTLDDAHMNGIPVFIFMHHPPMNLGLPNMDVIKNKDGEALLDLIKDYNNVKYLFMGHVHRPIHGTVRGIPFSTMKAISFQAPAPKPDWTWDSFAAAKEGPAYGILHIENGDVNLHYTQFCEYNVGIE